MKILLGLLLLFCIGCSSNNTIDYTSMGRPGTMYHTSGLNYFKCVRCHEKTNLFRLDNKDRVICKKCFKQDKNKGLYH